MQALCRSSRPGLPRRCKARRELVNFQKTTLCGHPKQGIQGEQNQSLANRLEVGFLGRFDLEVVST